MSGGRPNLNILDSIGVGAIPIEIAQMVGYLKPFIYSNQENTGYLLFIIGDRVFVLLGGIDICS